MPLTRTRLRVEFDRRWTLRPIGVSPRLMVMALDWSVELEVPVLPFPFPLLKMAMFMTSVVVMMIVTSAYSYYPGLLPPPPDDPVCVPRSVLASVVRPVLLTPSLLAVLDLLRILPPRDTDIFRRTWVRPCLNTALPPLRAADCLPGLTIMPHHTFGYVGGNGHIGPWC